MSAIIECLPGSVASAVAASRSVIWAEAPIDASEFEHVRRRALLDGCKWDPQVGDSGTLAAFPLVIKRSTSEWLASRAEELAAETANAEAEISQRPELLKCLGLPHTLRQILSQREPFTPAPGRVMRFDFHLTTAGWRISEVNSDVPGGFTEASFFTQLVADYYPQFRTPGDPGRAWSEALATSAQRKGVIALLSAPGYMEDHQVVAYLAKCLTEKGCRPFLAKPEQIEWKDGSANLNLSTSQGPIDVIVKFYQAEWLCRLPSQYQWKCYFRGGSTPVANPAAAVISESKRLPLVWDRLYASMPAWRALLPETCDPRDVDWRNEKRWLLKTALCNTGDTVSVPDLMAPSQWFRTRLSALVAPRNWVAQRQFESVPVSTPVGQRHACLGVFTVNGKAAGIYARLSEKRVIDYAATDVALLIDDDE